MIAISTRPVKEGRSRKAEGRREQKNFLEGAFATVSCNGTSVTPLPPATCPLPTEAEASVKQRESLSASLIACGAFTLAIVHIAQDYPVLWGVVALVVLYYLLTQGAFNVKLSRKKVLGILGVLAIPVAILLWETPSHAVLLLGAQNFLTNWLSNFDYTLYCWYNSIKLKCRVSDP